MTRIKYFDVLNILACLSVVFLHHNALVHGWQASSAWAQALIVEVVCYWAVPVFLMLSGATLLDYRKKYDTKTFFKKRFVRVLIPFLFWSSLLLVKQCLQNNTFLPDYHFSTVINAILGYQALEIYYFFPLILSIYLLFPMLSLLTENRKILWYICISIFACDSIIIPLGGVMDINSLAAFRLPIETMLIYPLLGYLLSTTNISRKQRFLIYFSAIVVSVFRYAWTYHYSCITGATDRTWFAYQSFCGVILACGIFVFFKYLNLCNNLSAKLLSLLSSCSLGVYLIHRIIMEYEPDVFGVEINGNNWRWIFPFVTYFICIVIVLLLKKTPWINKVVP